MYCYSRFKEKFSKFVIDILYRAVHSVRLPMWGQVFEYYVDEATGTFTKWSDKQQGDKVKSIGGSFFLTPEVRDLIMGQSYV